MLCSCLVLASIKDGYAVRSQDTVTAPKGNGGLGSGLGLGLG